MPPVAAKCCSVSFDEDFPDLSFTGFLLNSEQNYVFCSHLKPSKTCLPLIFRNPLEHFVLKRQGLLLVLFSRSQLGGRAFIRLLSCGITSRFIIEKQTPSLILKLALKLFFLIMIIVMDSLITDIFILFSTYMSLVLSLFLSSQNQNQLCLVLLDVFSPVNQVYSSPPSLRLHRNAGMH